MRQGQGAETDLQGGIARQFRIKPVRASDDEGCSRHPVVAPPGECGRKFPGLVRLRPRSSSSTRRAAPGLVQNGPRLFSAPVSLAPRP